MNAKNVPIIKHLNYLVCFIKKRNAIVRQTNTFISRSGQTIEIEQNLQAIQIQIETRHTKKI